MLDRPAGIVELGAARIEARTDPGNVPSQRLLAAAGFAREGLERRSRVIKGARRDMVCWSLLPEDLGDHGACDRGAVPGTE
jgi:RimJ/RimL family protein N-acetyltransferase